MWKSGESQLTQGRLSSFISRAPLWWLSNGPRPWVGPETACRALPAKTHAGGFPIER